MPQSTNVTELKKRLIELHLKLRKFDQGLKDNFTRLDSSWHRLDQAWDGHAYQEFNGSWQSTRQTIKQYNELSSKYEAFLLERIAALEEFERQG